MWAFPPRDHPFSIASAESLGDGLGSTTSAKTAVTVRKAGAGANAEADAIRAAITMARCSDSFQQDLKLVGYCCRGRDGMVSFRVRIMVQEAPFAIYLVKGGKRLV